MIMKHVKTAKLIFQMFFLLGMLPLLSCTSQAQPVSSKEKVESNLQLAFFNYTISKDLNGNLETHFINKTITKGRLKDTSNKKVLSNLGDIMCIQYDKNNFVLERSYINNPLNPIVEYVNDDGDLEKRQLDLDRAEFSIKMQLNELTQSIRLIMIDASGKPSTELITTSISK